MSAIVPGFYDEVPEADYHADRTSLSHSGAKTLLKAPALYLHQLDNPVTKRVFDFGSAAHKLVLGAGEPIVVLHRYDPKTGDDLGEAKDYRSPTVGEHAEKIRADGGIPLLRKELDVVEAMAEKITGHRLAMSLLRGGRPEVSAYAVDEPTGVMRRCRFDYFAPVVTDYKTADTADPKAFGRKAADLGYHCQAAWYLDVAADLGKPRQAFAFIVQQKTPPYLVSVCELTPRAVDRGRELNRRALEIFRDCSESGVWPGYVDDAAFASVDLPGWAYFDNDLEMWGLPA